MGLVNNGDIKLSYCASENQTADIMTKPLKLEQFEKLRGMLGVMDITKGKKRKTILKTKIDMVTDRISCLPGHVIDHILSYLSIREAVRTSVLSKIWKKKWYTLPNLVFDKHGVSAVDKDSMLLKIVDHVLLVHSGPINMFKFTNDYLPEIFEIDMDRWILHLTGRSIKELVLEVWIKEKPYKLPWCLFTCQSLHHLELKWCLLKPPKTFEGFMNLKSLELEGVTTTQDDFENLISGCPLLEKLKLKEVDGLVQINIHAQNLKVFEIFGKFDGISLDNSFELSRVVIDSWCDLISEDNQSTLPGRPSNLLKFFENRPHIKSLVIGTYFLKYLAAGDLPVKLPTPCVDLSYLSLSINFYDLKEISAFLSLLRSSPNLQKLEIYIVRDNVPLTPVSDGYSWEDVFSRPTTPIQVRHVTIDNISVFQPELDLIKFLLLYSPVLEKLIVKPVGNDGVELLTELVRFKRVSGEAEIIYDVQTSVG